MNHRSCSAIAIAVALNSVVPGVDAQTAPPAGNRLPTVRTSPVPGDNLPPTSAVPVPAAPPAVRDTPPPSVISNPTYYGASFESTTPASGTFDLDSSVAADYLSALAQNPLQWGPVQARPHIAYGLSYSRGLRQGNTATHTVSPGLTLQTKHITVDYTPSLVYYTQGPYADSLNHQASFDASFGYDDWSFGLSHDFRERSQILQETGRQTDTLRNVTGANANWRFADRASLSFSLSQSFHDSSGFADASSSKTWSTMEWLNYYLTPKFTVGVGVGAGYSEVDLGSDMTYELIQGRISFRPTPKFSASINGGFEFRQFLDVQGAEDSARPIMGASLTYRPFEQTTLSVSANRTVSTSIFRNQITESTSVAGSLNQRFLGRLNWTVSGGIRQKDYETSVFIFTFNRSDDTTFVSTSLGVRLLKRVSASVAYSRNMHESNQPGFTYDTDQYSLRLAYSF